MTTPNTCLTRGSDLRLISVLPARRLVDCAVAASARIREIMYRGRLAMNQLLLAHIGAIAVDALLLRVQQLRQRVLVVNFGRSCYRAVSQAALAIGRDVQLRAELPVSALARLMHLGIAGHLFILGPIPRADQGRI